MESFHFKSLEIYQNSSSLGVPNMELGTEIIITKKTKTNRYHRRHLREKRRATGVIHCISAESEGCSGVERDEEKDNEVKSSINFHLKEDKMSNMSLSNPQKDSQFTNDFMMTDKLKENDSCIKKLELKFQKFNNKIHETKYHLKN